MKKIVSLYLAVIFTCFVFGGVVALSKHYSIWYLFLLIFPILLGSKPIARMSKLLPDHLTKSAIFLFLMFLLFIAVLMVGDRCFENYSFWETLCGAGVFASGLVTAVLMLKVHNLLIIRGWWWNLIYRYRNGTDFLFY